jgi:hypothetical protein
VVGAAVVGAAVVGAAVVGAAVVGAAVVGAAVVGAAVVGARVVGGGAGVGVGGGGDVSKMSTASITGTVLPRHEHVNKFERKHKLTQQQRTTETTRKQRQPL